MDTIYVTLILLVCLEIYLRFEAFNKKKKENLNINKQTIKLSNEYPYKLNTNLLNQYEQNFLLALNIILNQSKYDISFKVSLKSIFNTYSPINHMYFNDQLKSRFIDFIIYDKNTFEPIILIDLVHIDDSKEDLIPTNDFLYYCCRNANIKLVRFREMKTYTALEIKDKLGIILE